MSIAKLDIEYPIHESKRGRLEVRPMLSFLDGDKIETYQPHDNVLVETLQIGGFDVKRVPVDHGSRAEIMCPNLC